MIVAALLVLLAGLATGIPTRSGVRERAPMAAHFPGQPPWPGARPPFRLRIWIAAAAVAAAAVAIPAVFDEALAALVLAVLGAAVLAAIGWRISAYARACVGVRAAVEVHAPLIAMPYAGTVGVHIGMWSPWIDRTGIPWCIVARTPELFDDLTQMYDIPILQGRIPATVGGALYPHGAAKNTDFIASSKATHVFLGHGDSDKPLSASERVLQYDLIAVAGQAAVDRFAAAGLAIPAERLRIIGRPQTEGIELARTEAARPATVLYAPTWRHADDTLNVSSLAVANQIAQALLDRGCTVIFRRHFAGENHLEAEAMIVAVNQLLEADARKTGRPHRWGTDAMEQPLIAAFNAADAMVSDVSGIVVDFMASQKPLVMYAAQFSDPEAFRAAHPTAAAAYVIDGGLTRLGQALDAALGNDPLAPRRAELADHYLGGPDRAEPARRFIELVTELGG